MWKKRISDLQLSDDIEPVFTGYNVLTEFVFQIQRKLSTWSCLEIRMQDKITT
jgi:hypothetical protein